MRIDRLDLFSYGHLRDQSLDLSRPEAGLTIVLGPNEAGKSTTLRAIRALLFGIERGTTDDYRVGRESLRIGAVIRDGDGVPHELIRQGLSKAPLVTPTGERVEEAFLAALIGNVERALFATLFCVDHDELHDQSAQLLDPEAEIGRLVFGASLGAAPLTRVLKDLEGRADGLFRPRGSTQLVARSLSRARELTQEMRQHRVRAREWEQAAAELKRLEEEATRLRASVAALRAEEGRVQRLISALPSLSRRAVELESMAECEREGRVQPSVWAEEVDRARTRLAESERELKRVTDARDDLRRQLDKLPATSALLVAADSIDELLQGIDRFRKDRDDLPGLEGQLAASMRVLADLLERLGIDEGIVRSVTDAQVAAIEELIQEWPALDGALTAARGELEALERGLADARRELQGLPEAPDTAVLERVTAVARTFLERERLAAKDRGGLLGLEGDIRVGAAPLCLEHVDLEALETLSAPAHAALRAHRQSLSDLESFRARLVAQAEELELQQEELRQQADSIRADATVPDPDEVPTARRHRDEGWAMVRAAWIDGRTADADVERWASGMPLADAYERSVQAADEADDGRYEHASQLATLEQLAASMSDLEGKREGALAELAATDDVGARLQADWTALWQPVGVCPAGVDEAEEWLVGLAELKRSVAERRRRAAVLEELEKELTVQSSAVGQALKALGEHPAEGSVALLVEQAEAFIASARTVADARSERLRGIAQGDRDKPRREDAVKTSDSAVAAWRVRWGQALGDVGMTGTTSLAAGRETLKLLREYRGTQKERATFRSRVDGVRADIGRFTTRVSTLVAEVAPDLDGLDPDRALSAIKPRLDDARREGRLREDVVSRLTEAGDLFAETENNVRDSREWLAGSRSQAGLDPEADLDLEIRRAREFAGCGATVRDLEQNLVEQSGMSVADLVTAVGELGDAEVRLSTALGDLRAELEGQDQLLEDTNRQVGDARSRLTSLNRQGEAAALEQDAELEFAVTAGHVSEFARVSLAAEVLRRVVSDYGQRNQGPILEFASRNFSTLTDGAFDALVPDYAGDRQVLLARRVNGEHLHLPELSEGTVDQLYLAMRLAGIEHHLAQATASPPVVLDDILVNFDDDRAAAALRLFVALGERAQVLLFTHHRHIVSLAERELDDSRLHIARLNARDHAAAFEAPERPAAAPVRGRSPAGRGGAAPQDAIVLVLRSAASQLGKSDILERAGITDSEWTPAIRALVDSGTVTQEGVKRGAKYRLAL